MIFENWSLQTFHLDRASEFSKLFVNTCFSYQQNTNSEKGILDQLLQDFNNNKKRCTHLRTTLILEFRIGS